MTDVKISVEELNPTLKVAHIVGQLDESNVDEKIQEIYKALDKAPKGLSMIFDMQSLDYMNSKSIGYLTDLYGKITELGGKVAICSAKPNILDILQVVGLTQLMQNYDSLESAKAALGTTTVAQPSTPVATPAVAPATPTPEPVVVAQTPATTPATTASAVQPEPAVTPVQTPTAELAQAAQPAPTPAPVTQPAVAPVQTPVAQPAAPVATPAVTPAPTTPAVEPTPVVTPATTEPTPTPAPAESAQSGQVTSAGAYKFES